MQYENKQRVTNHDGTVTVIVEKYYIFDDMRFNTMHDYNQYKNEQKEIERQTQKELAKVQKELAKAQKKVDEQAAKELAKSQKELAKAQKKADEQAQKQAQKDIILSHIEALKMNVEFDIERRTYKEFKSNLTIIVFFAIACMFI